MSSQTCSGLQPLVNFPTHKTASDLRVEKIFSAASAGTVPQRCALLRGRAAPWGHTTRPSSTATRPQKTPTQGREGGKQTRRRRGDTTAHGRAPAPDGARAKRRTKPPAQRRTHADGLGSKAQHASPPAARQGA